MFKKITQKVGNNRKKDPIVINKQEEEEDINSEKENPAVIETKVINKAAVIETNKKINKAVIKKKNNGLIDNLLDDVTLSCCAAAPISNSTMSGSDDEDAKSADLDAELDALDIDNDFTLSFGEGDDDDASDDNDKSSDDDAVLVDSVMAPPKKKVPTVADPAYATLQLSRDEVFSRHYHANPAEEEALKDVSIQLGVTTKHTLSLSSTVLTLLSTTTTNVNKDDPDYRGNSILLKRGIVSIGGGQEEKELLLFTHGFIVARKAAAPAASIGLRASVMGMVMPSAPKFDSCHYYQHVNWVKDLWQLTNDSDPKYSYSIQISDASKKTKELQFHAASLQDKQSWLAAWERVLLQNRSRRDASDRIVGWQHTLLQTSLYTAAVTGQAFFGPHHLQQANVLDEYNGLAPLHYAAIHNQVHVIEELLSMEHQTGDDDANVELEDAEGRTPMYYAERDNMAPAIEALQKGGAVASAAFEREQHGALVEEARELEATTKQEQETNELMQGAAATPDTGRRRSWLTQAFAGLDNEKYSQEEAPAVAKAHQAQSAQSHMKDALAGIHDRGDKINDLGDKTAELEDNAAEFQDLAAQLRQKMEKQNKGLNFLNPFAR